ncbi:BAR domain [Popillia japonica]|uniref:BAR domain n=1 Tax=Popillia japonica TaxID=7064 RepID=A0AAW1ICI2_POPJA
MSVRLPPLEFTECITDSPYFRENLHKHEKELENTNHQIKRLIKEVKELLDAANKLSQAQRSFAKCLEGFKFECIGSTQTDDERVICKSLEEFSRLINAIEDERGRMVRVQYNYNNLMPYNVPYLRFILYTVSGKPRQTPTIYRDIVCM